MLRYLLKAVAGGVFLTLAVTSAKAGLAFTEIMYNSGSAQPNWEWVELHNRGPATVNLAGYLFDDDDGGVLGGANIASGTITAGGTAVLFNSSAVSAANFAAAWGAGINLISVSNWPTLNNDGDVIALWDSFASYSGRNLLNATIWMSYDDLAPWPTSVNPASIALQSASADFSQAANWSKSVINVDGAYQSTASGGNSGLDIGSPGSVVPEPSAVWALCIASVLTFNRRRRDSR